MSNLLGQQAILDLIADSSREKVRRAYGDSFRAGRAPIGEEAFEEMFRALRDSVNGQNYKQVSMALIKLKETLECTENLGIDLHFNFGASILLERAESKKKIPDSEEIDNILAEEQILADSMEYSIHHRTVIDMLQKIFEMQPELEDQLNNWVRYHHKMCEHCWKIAICLGMDFALGIYDRSFGRYGALLREIQAQLGIQTVRATRAAS